MPSCIGAVLWRQPRHLLPAQQLAGSLTKRVLGKLDQEVGNYEYNIGKMKGGNLVLLPSL